MRGSSTSRRWLKRWRSMMRGGLKEYGNYRNQLIGDFINAVYGDLEWIGGLTHHHHVRSNPLPKRWNLQEIGSTLRSKWWSQSIRTTERRMWSRKIWKMIGNLWKSWKCLEIFGNLRESWKCLEMFGNLENVCKSLEIMKIFVNLWKSWKCLEILKLLWEYRCFSTSTSQSVWECGPLASDHFFLGFSVTYYTYWLITLSNKLLQVVSLLLPSVVALVDCK